MEDQAPKKRADLSDIQSLDAKVDGYFINRPHQWIVARKKSLATTPFDDIPPQALEIYMPPKMPIKTSKPIIASGFTYLISRAMTGDSVASYIKYMNEYETWLVSEKFTGYYRNIGTSIPAKISGRLDFIKTASK